MPFAKIKDRHTFLKEIGIGKQLQHLSGKELAFLVYETGLSKKDPVLE